MDEQRGTLACFTGGEWQHSLIHLKNEELLLLRENFPLSLA